MNEAWLILYNRFRVGKGPGVFAKTASFDHIIRGNIFALEDPQQTAFVLSTPDCIGTELIDNRILGGRKQLVSGKAQPAVERGNRLLGLTDDVPLPKLPVLSIFQWQRNEQRNAQASK